MRPADDDAPIRLVLFEPEEHGHQAEYLEHVLGALPLMERRPDVRVVVAPGLAARLRTDGMDAGARVEALDETDAGACNRGGPAARARARWAVLTRLAAASPPSSWVAMELDTLQLPLALGRRLPAGHTLSGILFRPSFHRANGSARAGERLRDLRKRVLYGRMLANPVLRAVLALDPSFPDAARRHFGARGQKVVWLPDPVPPTVEKVASAPVDAPEGRLKLLLFGALAERKGVLQLLEALQRMPDADASRLAVVLAGRVNPVLQDRLNAAIAAARAARPGLWLELLDRRVSEEELSGLLEWCDVVLAPYQRFVGSSGVLLRAAAVGRPVLTQDYGLVGEATRAHGLGVALDTTNADAIAAALSAMVRDGAPPLDARGREQFLAGRTPETFGRVLLSAALAVTG